MSPSDRPTKARKRKHGASASSHTPEISGIPIEISPFHLHAVKTATSYTKLSLEVASSPQAAFAGSCPVTNSISAVEHNIFARIDDSLSLTASSSKSERELENLKQHRDKAVAQWMEAIHRCIRQYKPMKSDQNETKQRNAGLSIPVDVLKHLLGIFSKKGHVSRKIATIHMSSHLLDKSAECRRWWFEDSNIVSWMDSLASTSTLTGGLQLAQESHKLLHGLHLKYADMYPTLVVAAQRFRQLYPAAVDNVAGLQSNNIISIWASRRIRDIAMANAHKEENRLKKLIHRAHACTEVLVPRITDESPEHAKLVACCVNENDEDDDDDHSVEWEDGWNEEVENVTTDAEEKLHAEAVNRTLEQMKYVGEVHESRLEIKFPAHVEPGEPLTGEKEAARKQLQEIVQILETRHMTRLSLWVESLTRADCLLRPDSNKVRSSALISMSHSKIQERNAILRQLVDLKQEVVRIVSSAKRLGLYATKETKQVPPVQNTKLQQPKRALQHSSRNKKSSRIEIKLRKTSIK